MPAAVRSPIIRPVTAGRSGGNGTPSAAVRRSAASNADTDTSPAGTPSTSARSTTARDHNPSPASAARTTPVATAHRHAPTDPETARRGELRQRLDRFTHHHAHSNRTSKCPDYRAAPETCRYGTMCVKCASHDGSWGSAVGSASAYARNGFTRAGEPPPRSRRCVVWSRRRAGGAPVKFFAVLQWGRWPPGPV